MTKRFLSRIYRAIIKMRKSINTVIQEISISNRRKKYRKKLKNKDFSIICSNCIGGEIYNLLGEKFLSPTINMWQEQSDFIKFALDLKYYLEQPLEFIETNELTPVAKCGDILLHFNHHDNAEDAEYDWNRRKHRINFDNIYIILYNRKLSLEEIKKIEQAECKNIAVLTDKPLPLKYAVLMKPNLDRQYGDHFIDKDRRGIYTYEKQWDFVEWLNSEL